MNELETSYQPATFVPFCDINQFIFLKNWIKYPTTRPDAGLWSFSLSGRMLNPVHP